MSVTYERTANAFFYARDRIFRVIFPHKYAPESFPLASQLLWHDRDLRNLKSLALPKSFLQIRYFATFDDIKCLLLYCKIVYKNFNIERMRGVAANEDRGLSDGLAHARWEGEDLHTTREVR